MQGLATKIINLAVIAVVGSTAACRADDPAHGRSNADTGGASIEPEEVVVTITEEERAAAEAKLQAQADSVDKKLRRIPNLTRQEKSTLKKDVNAVQIARAQQLGVRPGTPIESLAESGKLVRLPDTTEYWIIRKLTYS